MAKTYRRRDRTWRECISLEEFQQIARETVGRERPNKEADDWCKNLFGKVASPGVRHPLRRKQREEAMIAGLERVEGNQRNGGHKSKDHNSGKRKGTIDSSHHPQDRRPHHRESTYSENVGRAIGGSPLRAVLFQQFGPVSPIPPVTPTRLRLSRPLVPLGSMTNLAGAGPTTPPKSPLDDQEHARLRSGESGGLKDSRVYLSDNPNPFVDDDCKRVDRVSLGTSRTFVIPPPAPPLSPPTTTQRRKWADPQGDTDLHILPSNSLTKVGIDIQVAIGKPIPLVSHPQSLPNSPQISLERPSQSIAERSLLTPVSNGPIKRVPPPASSPAVPGVERASAGVKRKRENSHSPSRKVVLVESPALVQKVSGPSRNLKPFETWSPDETTFMEGPRPTRDVSRSKTRGGDMSVDAIKARLVRATSTLQILPSHKPDTTVRNPTVVIEARGTKSKGVDERVDPIVCGKTKTLEGGGIELDRLKVGPPAPRFGIPAPFPPGTSDPGSALENPNNSDKIAAYHGADRYYSSRPPPSVTPPQLSKGPDSAEESCKLLALTPGEHKKPSQGDIPTRRPVQPEPEDNNKALGRFPSLVLEPQQLLFTGTAVGKLLSTSVIWFARDVHLPEPPYRPSSLQLVPRLNEVSQLESLLVACGWHRKRSFTSKRGIERGVVFVDYEEQSDVQAAVKTHWVAQRCENAYQLATRYHSPAERGMKPIWVMDARVLRWDRLQTMRRGNKLDTLEEFVLWKE